MPVICLSMWAWAHVGVGASGHIGSELRPLCNSRVDGSNSAPPLNGGHGPDGFDGAEGVPRGATASESELRVTVARLAGDFGAPGELASSLNVGLAGLAGPTRGALDPPARPAGEARAG